MVAFGHSVPVTDPFVLVAIVASVAGLTLFPWFEEPPQRTGTVLLFGGLTLAFTGLYATETLAVLSRTAGLVLGSIAFVLVTVGGYITYRESAA